MSPIKINDLIVVDPEICHGNPTILGTRVMVWQILELLENGESEEEIQEAFPTLPKGAIKASLEYATKKVKESSYSPFPTQV